MALKKYEDFSKELYELFPYIEERSIDNIVKHGFIKLLEYIRFGNDIVFKNNAFSLFIGKMTKAGVLQWANSKVKEHVKIRLLHKASKKIWDGYHYLGLTEEENSEFIVKGLLPMVSLYKLLKESGIRKDIKFIYKVKLGYTIPEKEILWMEKREIKIRDCEISEEGVAWLNKRNQSKSI